MPCYVLCPKGCGLANLDKLVAVVDYPTTTGCGDDVDDDDVITMCSLISGLKHNVVGMKEETMKIKTQSCNNLDLPFKSICSACLCGWVCVCVCLHVETPPPVLPYL